MFSILFGILASVLPNLFFYWLYFALDASAPRQFVKTIYIVEGLKFVILAAVIISCLQWPGLQINKFIFGFVLAEVSRIGFHLYKLVRIRA